MTGRAATDHLLIAGVGVLGVLLAGFSLRYETGDQRLHAAPVAVEADHDHARLQPLPPGAPTPTLDFNLTPDPSGGWNLHVLTTNFRFAPENVNGAHLVGEGHAHVYVNGEKLARLYGPWFHIAALPAGDMAVTVTLNANDHATLAVSDKALAVTKTVATGAGPGH